MVFIVSKGGAYERYLHERKADFSAADLNGPAYGRLLMLVNALYNIVDSLFVARISEEAMTALSLVYPVQNLINAIAIGFSIGIAALISASRCRQQRKG